MTFTTACHIIRTVVDNNDYKLIRRYAHSISWAFRLQRDGRHYSCVQVVAIKEFDLPFSSSLNLTFNQSPLSLSDRIALINIENNTWNFPNRQFHDRRDEFKRITGFPC